MNTTFEEFARVVCLDKRSETLDAGNVKLAYHGFVEKVLVINFFFLFLAIYHCQIFNRQKEEKKKDYAKKTEDSGN